MAKTVIGKVGITPKGSYSNATQYKRLDVVACDGCSYVCLQDCVGIAVTNTNYWQLMAEKGHYTEQDREDFKQAVVQESKNEMDTYTNTKKTEIDTYVENYEGNLKSSLDNYEETKETELNTLATDLKRDFNTNATSETTTFNENATAKTTEFNTNATNKTTEFNTNAETKTSNFNANAIEKTTEYNTNANTKVEEYDANATAKIAEYDAHVEELQTEINNLKETVDSELETAVVEGNTIDITDSAKADGSIVPKGNTYQEYLIGKNSFDSSTVGTGSINGIAFSYDKETQEITLNGTCTKDNTLIQFYNTSLVATKSQTKFSVFHVEGSVTGYAKLRFYTANYTTNTVLDLSELASNNKLEKTATNNYESTLNNIRLDKDAICNNLKIKIMVTDNENTDFEPYCGEQESPNPKYPQKIKVVTGDNTVYCVGKNWLPCNNAKFENSTTGWYFLDGKGSAFGVKIGDKTTQKAKVKKGESYTMSYIINTAPSTFQLVCEDETVIKAALPVTIGLNTYSFVSDRDGYAIPRVRLSADNTKVDIAEIQIEQGNNATKSKSYKLQEFPLNLGDMELCQIDDYEDVLFKNEKTSKYYNSELDENAWYKKKNINKKIFDGTETFYYISGNGYFALNKTATELNGKANDIVICTHFRFANSYDVQEGIRSGNNYYLQFIDKDITEANAFKNILAQEYEKGTPVTVYYPAMNPTCEKITNQPLIAQLEAIHKFRTEQGVNHIWTEAQELEPNLEVTYKKSKKLEDENKFAEMQAEIDELKALVIESNS